jgi:DNA adenine methylase
MWYIGGKATICDWIYNNFTDHNTYVELFGGSGAVMLNKPSSRKEIYNEINSDIYNLFSFIKHKPQLFFQKVKNIIPSRETFDKVKSIYKSDNFVDLNRYDKAFIFFCFSRMSYSGAMQGYSNDCPNKMNFQTGYDDKINNISERLQNVKLINKDFEYCIDKYDSPTTLFYADPPYLNLKLYKYNFTDADHLRLRDALSDIEGKFTLSYYCGEFDDCGDSQIAKMYNGFYVKNKLTKKVASNLKKKKSGNELLITNYKTENCEIIS